MGSRLSRRLVVMATACLGIAAGPAFAKTDPAPAATPFPVDPALAAQIAKANAECTSCHSKAGVQNPPRADLDIAKLKETRVEPDVYKGSNHGHMECAQCHGKGYKDYPHEKEARAQLSPCDECHAAKVMKVETQFDISVHAKNVKDKFTCNSCHDAHVALVWEKLRDPKKIVAQDNHMCLECHNSDLTFAKYAPKDEKNGNGKKPRPDIDRIHKWLPNARLHWEAVRCVDCHTPASKGLLSHDVVNKEKAEKNCVTCHSANSSLATRLYRHLAKAEQQKYGFANSAVLSSSYVIGATRHPVLDSLVIALAGLTVGGLSVHGGIRVILAIFRRRKQK